MRAGDEFIKENLQSIRPGPGLPPKCYKVLLGKRIGRDVKEGDSG
jgi:N-acetylneuraminate synthase (EC 2.5.1.56)